MRARSLQPVICLVILSAYLLNLGFAAGGAVLCRDADGQARIELVCDHGHCDETDAITHEHEDDPCECSGCPCDDSSLGIHVVATRKDEQNKQASAKSQLLASPVLAQTIVWESSIRPVAPRAPPRADQRIKLLRSIILIV